MYFEKERIYILRKEERKRNLCNSECFSISEPNCKGILVQEPQNRLWRINITAIV